MLKRVVVYSLYCSKAVSLVLFILCVALWLFGAFWVDCLQSAIVYERQNFLKVGVHVITTDQCNQTAGIVYL